MFKEKRAINKQLIENNKPLIKEGKDFKQSDNEGENKREQTNLTLLETVRTLREIKK